MWYQTLHILRDFNPASHKSNLFLIHISKACTACILFFHQGNNLISSVHFTYKQILLQLWINKMQNLPKLIPHNLYRYFFLKRSHNSHAYYWWYCRCKIIWDIFWHFVRILWLLQKRLTFRKNPIDLLLYALPQT